MNETKESEKEFEQDLLSLINAYDNMKIRFNRIHENASLFETYVPKLQPPTYKDKTYNLVRSYEIYKLLKDKLFFER